jgi:DNA-binding MarR family transcriptional regulator/GNAT superfamily N-acetyltransferase
MVDALANPETGTEADRVDAIRRFNRFYTRQIGVLREGLLDSPFTLTQVRVLYELAQQQAPTATDLGRELQLDPGYLSRILRAFERKRLITRESSEADGRQQHLLLTRTGRQAIASLQDRARDEVRGMLAPLAEPDQRRLLAAMQVIERLLAPADAAAAAAADKIPYILRPHQPGDIGWIIHRHGVLYAQEYHWDETFEALVATIAGEFVQRFEAKRERCWIAERDGEIVGCVFLVKGDDDATAKLRLLLVEPSARGLGIGGRLVDECVRFARRVGYRRLTLWTQANLLAARRIYERAGFRLVKSVANHAFGHDLVSETWDLHLDQEAHPSPGNRMPARDDRPPQDI